MLRRAITIMAFLLLGVIVNIAVAWWCATSSLSRSARSLHIREYRYDTDRSHTKVWKCTGYLKVTEDRPGSSRRLLASDPNYLNQEALHSLLPRHSAFRDGSPIDRSPEATAYATHSFSEVSAGWPCYALRETIHRAGRVTPDFELFEGSAGVLTIPDGLLPADWSHELPTSIVWLGFFANTVFYATGLWLLARIPRLLRHWLRRRRGHCTACNYDLRANTAGVCPECGTEANP